jgi:hypothetical protein
VVRVTTREKPAKRSVVAAIRFASWHRETQHEQIARRGYVPRLETMCPMALRASLQKANPAMSQSPEKVGFFDKGFRRFFDFSES